MCIHNKKLRALSTSSVDMHRGAGQCSCQCVDLQQRLSGGLAHFSSHTGARYPLQGYLLPSLHAFFVILKILFIYANVYVPM